MNKFWYDLNGKALSEAVFQYIHRLDQDQPNIQLDNLRNMRLYGNMESSSLRNYGLYRAEPVSAVANRVTLNVIQSMIDTVVSKLAKNKPRPSFLTDGGDWEQQRKAKKLTQFTDGLFYLTDYYAKRAMALQDSCIFGTGALKVFKDADNKIKLERVFIDELKVDTYEALYGEPRQLHQVKYIHKDVLISMFPDKEADIRAATDTRTLAAYQSNSTETTSQMIRVVESWRLPTGPDKEDGLHTICIDGLMLSKEEYDKHYFPFLFWRWGIRPVGFFGQGLAEQLTGIQLEINKILRTIQISMHLVSVPKIFVEASSKVVSSHLNNKIGGIIKYVGQPPVEGKLGTIPPDLFTHLDRLYARAFEIAGVSQLSAMASKPQGLNSGKALREYNDIESERFMAVAQRDEQVAIDAARMFIDIAKEIDEDIEGGFEVKTQGSKSLERIKWKDVALEEDAYIMQCFPVSALSKTPAGRLQDVQELMAANLISPQEGLKLLDFPDLQQFYNFNNAALHDIDRTIELMIDSGKYETPEPYQNLQAGIAKMQQAYLLYKSQGAPETRLELFRRWIEDADSLIKRAEQEAAQAQEEARIRAELAANPAPPAAPAPIPEAAPEEVPVVDETALPVQ